MSFLKNTVAAAALAVGFAAAPAMAAPISPNQSFDINGSLQASGSPFDQANGLDFGVGTSTPIVYNTPSGTAIVGGGASGSDFISRGFSSGDEGAIVDIADGNLTTGAKNIASFISFDDSGNQLRFDLVAITNILRAPANAGNSNTASLIVSGTGVVRLTGFDATTASFSLTTTNAGSGSEATFAASVNTGTNPSVVPEPASMALLGMGLAGLGLVRRRKA